MRASLPRRRLITWSALTLRSSSGFSCDEHAAHILRAASAVKPDTSRPPDPACTMLSELVQAFRRMAVKEMSWSATIEPVDAAGILLREKSFGNDDVEIDA